MSGLAFMPYGPLSPNGSRIASNGNSAIGAACTGGTVGLFDLKGRWTTTAAIGDPMGWVDGNHIVLAMVNSPVRNVFDIGTGATSPIQAAGFFAAALPGGL